MGLLDRFRRRPIVPEHLLLHTGDCYLDGGTISLVGPDEHGRSRCVILGQTMFTDYTRFGLCIDRFLRGRRGTRSPGRLYLDGSPVAVRSVPEARLLAVLRAADVRGDGDPMWADSDRAEYIRSLRDRVVEFVESPDYVTLAARFGPA